MHVLVFTVDDTRFAIDIARLVEIVGRVQLSNLAGAADFVAGMFVHRTRPCVAISLRRRFGCAPKKPSLEDHFVVVEGRRQRFALVVDRVEGDRVVADDLLSEPPTAARHVKGVLTLSDGLVLLEDLDALLTVDEERALEATIAASAS